MIPINENSGVTIVTKVIPTEKKAVGCSPRVLLMKIKGKAANEKRKKSASRRPEEYFKIVLSSFNKEEVMIVFIEKIGWSLNSLPI